MSLGGGRWREGTGRKEEEEEQERGKMWEEKNGTWGNLKSGVLQREGRNRRGEERI